MPFGLSSLSSLFGRKSTSTVEQKHTASTSSASTSSRAVPANTANANCYAHLISTRILEDSSSSGQLPVWDSKAEHCAPGMYSCNIPVNLNGTSITVTKVNITDLN